MQQKSTSSNIIETQSRRQKNNSALTLMEINLRTPYKNKKYGGLIDNLEKN